MIQKKEEMIWGNIKAGLIFRRDQEVVWRCQNCGYLHTGTQAPDLCASPSPF